jgi:ABC-2 type transport system permease protein
MLGTLFYVFCLLSLGLLISTRAENQMQALQMTMMFILPSVFFSGFIFPRETMPWVFYAFSTVLPATYYIELERALVLRGATLTDFWFNLVMLAMMGVAFFSLCALRFRRKIA